jgi:23S rRNA pseudouridine2605 synthase
MPPGDSGLVIFTTDGQLANALMRQAPTRSSVYSVRVLLPAPDFETAHLATGVEYDDERVEFTSVESAGGEGANRWFQVVAPHADRRAAVRALFESQGLKVSRLIQIRYGGIDLPRDLPRGRHRALSAPVVAALREQAGLEPEPPKAAPDRPRARSPRKRHGSPPRRNALRKVKRTHK